MSRNDDFDRVLTSWLRRQAPPQAPDRVLDAALGRVAIVSQKRSWLRRLIGGNPVTMLTRVAAVGAVVAFAVFIGLQLSNLTGTVGSSQSPAPSSTPAQSSSPTPTPEPSSPEPSAKPTDAPLVLRLSLGREDGRAHALTLLEDGRLITTDQTGLNPPTERRLSAAGVQLIRDELAATGLTDTSADYFPVPRPGVEPPPFGGAGPLLEVGQPGGDTTAVAWFLFGEPNDYFEPQPEAEALETLKQRLLSLDEWLPSSAWADPDPRTYVPSRYRLLIATQPWGGSLDDLGVETSSVSWPLDGRIDTFGDLMNETGEPSVRCGLVTASDGLAVIGALEAAGATPSAETYLSFRLGERATSMVVDVTLEPILPHGEEICR